MRACVRACVRARARACVCVRACVHVLGVVRAHGLSVGEGSSDDESEDCYVTFFLINREDRDYSCIHGQVATDAFFENITHTLSPHWY